jgi:hypothetical protein
MPLLPKGNSSFRPKKPLTIRASRPLSESANTQIEFRHLQASAGTVRCSHSRAPWQTLALANPKPRPSRRGGARARSMDPAMPAPRPAPRRRRSARARRTSRERACSFGTRPTAPTGPHRRPTSCRDRRRAVSSTRSLASAGNWAAPTERSDRRHRSPHRDCTVTPRGTLVYPVKTLPVENLAEGTRTSLPAQRRGVTSAVPNERGEKACRATQSAKRSK